MTTDQLLRVSGLRTEFHTAEGVVRAVDDVMPDSVRNLYASLRSYLDQSHFPRLFGDLPFYVAPDSAETWAHPEQFQLDAQGRATAVAGVGVRRGRPADDTGRRVAGQEDLSL